MYSKEEEKNIRMAFWEGFRKYSTPRRRKQGKPRKWMMQNTGIKAIDLKFYIGRKHASVSLDVVAKSLDRRVAIWNQLLGLKTLLNKSFDQEVIWNDMFVLESGKEIIRIGVYLDDVDIFNKNSWDKIYDFFFTNMMKLEDWFEEYKDILKL